MQFSMGIPVHLQSKAIPKHNDHPLRRYADYFEITVFGEVNEEDLNFWYQSRPDEFWSLVLQLGLFGVSFTGDLSKYRSNPITQLFICSPESQGKLLRFIGPLALLRTPLVRNGILYCEDLDGFPVDSLNRLTGALSPIDDVQKELVKQGIRIVSADDYSKVKCQNGQKHFLKDRIQLRVGSKVLNVPSRLWDHPIQADDAALRSCRALVVKLNSMGITRVGELPADCNELFSRLRGVGTKKTDCFAKWLDSLVNEQTDMPSTSQQGHRVALLDEEIVIPESLLDYPIQLNDSFFKHQHLIHEFFRESGFVKLSDLPHDLGHQLLRRYGIGPRKVRKVAAWLKELVETRPQPTVPGPYCDNAMSSRSEPVPCLKHPPWASKTSPLDLLQEGWFRRFHQEWNRLRKNSTVLESYPAEVLDQLAKWGYDTGFSRPATGEEVRNDFNRYVSQCLTSSIPLSPFVSARYWHIVQIRVQLLDRGVHTLSAVADQIGLTRERVRQLLPKAVREVFGPVLAFFSMTLTILEEFGPIAPLEAVFRDLTPLARKVAVDVFQLVIDRYQVDTEVGLIARTDFCGDLRAWYRTLSTEIHQEFSGRAASGEAITEALGTFDSFRNLNTTSTLNEWSHFIRGAFFRETTDGRYVLRNQSRTELLELVMLERFPDGIRLSTQFNTLKHELCTVAPKEFGNCNVRSVRGLFSESSKLIMWGRGFYRHADTVPHPKGLLDQISRWLESRLTVVESISVEKAYEEFFDALHKADIPNAYALYSLLRLHFPTRFQYHRYPRVASPETQVSKSRLDELVEFINSRGECTRKELEREFIGVRGWRSYSLDQCLYRALEERVVRQGEHIYTTIDNLTKLNDAGIKRIERLLLDYFQKTGGPISVRLVYNNHKVTCLKMGLRSYYALFDVIRIFLGDSFYLSFPHASLVGEGQGRLSNRAILDEYVKNCPSTIFRTELVKEFVHNRGWSERQLDNAIRSAENLVLVGQGEFVHKEKLDWNPEKQARLVQVVRDFLEGRGKGDDPRYATVAEVYQHISKFLPDVGKYVSWSEQLLESLLSDDDSFTMIKIGMGGSPIVVDTRNTGSDDGIGSPEDVLGHILRTEFRGYAKYASLEQYLRDRGMIGKQIPKQLRKPSEHAPYRVIGDEFIHMELWKGA